VSRHPAIVLALLAAWRLITPSVASGQDSSPAALAQESARSPLPFVFDGPPPPMPPEVIARDRASDRVTIRAVRLDTPLKIDGRLDDEVYATTKSMSDFIQIEPHEGEPATERTEVWIFYDRDHVYVSARCWDSHPERMIEKEMRHDNTAITQNEYFAFSFDTFYDRRNGVAFTVASTGGHLDGQVANEKDYNIDWNPIWSVAVQKFEGGWTLEAAIPFKSLRYRQGAAQIWGFQALRNNRWKNESSFLTKIPAIKGTGNGLMMFSRAATLVGIDAPPGARALDIKPYVISDLTSDVTTTPPTTNKLHGDFGVDAKYGITQNLSADFTYNTDFAQVEADEQQVNLTRFSLFFPEKREFFLENQGLFAFGGVPPTSAAGDVPIMFYSRRIGLSQGRSVPIPGGGRLTGRVGRTTIGVLNMQSGDEPDAGAVSTNFTVVRLKRDVLRRSAIGVIATNRSLAEVGSGVAQAYGADGTFAFFDNLFFNGYWAQTRTQGSVGKDTSSYRADAEYTADRYGLQLERLVVGAGFDPGIGYVHRQDLHKTYALARFSPRPQHSALVRKISYTGASTYITNGSGQVVTKDLSAQFSLLFQNSDQFLVNYDQLYDLLTQPFAIAPGVTVPTGGYDYGNLQVGYNFGQQWIVSGNLLAEYGTFYTGHKTAISFSKTRINLQARLYVEPTVSLNRVDLAQGSFTTRLIGSRVTYTATPLMFVSALVQYNSSTNSVAANIRLRWEYQPGSELFVVYNDQRDTLSPGFPQLTNRAVIIKVNRVFRL
jgi:hypothetical protein